MNDINKGYFNELFIDYFVKNNYNNEIAYSEIYDIILDDK